MNPIHSLLVVGFLLATALSSCQTTSMKTSSTKAEGTGNQEYWCRETVSGGGMTVIFDYQVASGMDGAGASVIMAKPTMFHISNLNFSGTEDVQLALDIVHYGAPLGAPDYPVGTERRVVTFSWDSLSRTFASVATDSLPIYKSVPDSNNGDAAFYEFSVVINGKWFKNGLKRFRVMPKNTPGFCEALSRAPFNGTSDTH